MPNHNFIDRTGQTFGRLTVVSRAENTNRGTAQWNCKCTCGNIKIIQAKSLASGATRSCGCLQIKAAGKINYVHGMASTPEYRAWAHIIERCTMPEIPGYDNYGGRGILIYSGWRNDFMAFYNHVGPRPSKKYSIERICNDEGYFPGNIKWATNSEQCNNTRRNHKITINGKTMNLVNWAEIANIKYSTVWARIKRGWPNEKAVFHPVRKR